MQKIFFVLGIGIILSIVFPIAANASTTPTLAVPSVVKTQYIPSILTTTATRAYTTLEGFRLKELQYFTLLKEHYTSVLGTAALQTITHVLSLDRSVSLTTDTAPTAPARTDTSMVTYAWFLYAAAGKALFSHQASYYGVGILLVLFVLRIISKML